MPGLLGGGSAERSSCLAEGVGVQSGYPVTPLHSGSRFTGHQQSKGSKYHVEVEFKVRLRSCRFCTLLITNFSGGGRI